MMKLFLLAFDVVLNLIFNGINKWDVDDCWDVDCDCNC